MRNSSAMNFAGGRNSCRAERASFRPRGSALSPVAGLPVEWYIGDARRTTRTAGRTDGPRYSPRVNRHGYPAAEIDMNASQAAIERTQPAMPATGIAIPGTPVTPGATTVPAAAPSVCRALDASTVDQIRAVFWQLRYADANCRFESGEARARAERDPELAAALAAYTEAQHGVRSAGKRPAAAYQALRPRRYGEVRPDSALEQWLPKDSAFRLWLDPFTGGIQCGMSGLSAELREIAEDGERVFLLCFMDAGIAPPLQASSRRAARTPAGKGQIPLAFGQAAGLATTLTKALRNSGAQLRLTGHAAGADIANYVGLRLGLASVCFLAEGLDPACRHQLHDRLAGSALAQQLHISVDGARHTDHPPPASPEGADEPPQRLGTICELQDWQWRKLGGRGNPRLLSSLDPLFDLGIDLHTLLSPAH